MFIRARLSTTTVRPFIAAPPHATGSTAPADGRGREGATTRKESTVEDAATVLEETAAKSVVPKVVVAATLDPGGRRHGGLRRRAMTTRGRGEGVVRLGGAFV